MFNNPRSRVRKMKEKSIKNCKKCGCTFIEKRCKKCASIYAKIRAEDKNYKEKRRLWKKAWDAKNKEKVLSYAKEYNDKNRDSILLKKKQYREDNKEKISSYMDVYRIENKDYLLKKNAEYHVKNKNKGIEYRMENSEKIKLNSINYRIKNPNHTKEYYLKNKERISNYWKIRNKEFPEIGRIASHKRRALRKKCGGNLSRDIGSKLFILQKGKCACCKKSVKSGHHLDHIMPLALGGANEDSNIQILCPSCNCSKGAKHPQEFMQSRGFLL